MAPLARGHGDRSAMPLSVQTPELPPRARGQAPTPVTPREALTVALGIRPFAHTTSFPQAALSSLRRPVRGLQAGSQRLTEPLCRARGDIRSYAEGDRVSPERGHPHPRVGTGRACSCRAHAASCGGASAWVCSGYCSPSDSAAPLGFLSSAKDQDLRPAARLPVTGASPVVDAAAWALSGCTPPPRDHRGRRWGRRQRSAWRWFPGSPVSTPSRRWCRSRSSATRRPRSVRTSSWWSRRR